jgi:nicotinate-nucleotide adenylyltransferase
LIGVFGGTFDPVHLGHLRPAVEMAEEVGLDRVHVLPAGHPPHRGAPRVATEHRLAMLEAAIAGQPGFQLDRREVDREGPSYMAETLAGLRAEIGPDEPLALMLGMDAFLGLASWHQWERLPELAHIVVSHRPGWDPDSMEDQGGPLAALVAERGVIEPRVLADEPAGRVHLMPVTQLDISSTRIRAIIADGRSPRYLLPDAVCDYIHHHRLYRKD